jgi:hypothetical protein
MRRRDFIELVERTWRYRAPRARNCQRCRSSLKAHLAAPMEISDERIACQDHRRAGRYRLLDRVKKIDATIVSGASYRSRAVADDVDSPVCCPSRHLSFGARPALFILKPKRKFQLKPV